MAESVAERLTEFTGNDLDELCEATEAAIVAGGGFGWLAPPPRATLEAYWRGVLTVAERRLFVGRVDGVVAGSAQLMCPAQHNEAQAFAATTDTFFVAPWARGHGLARKLVEAVEQAARAEGFKVLNLDVLETQEAAILLYESAGFQRWGRHPKYAFMGGRYVGGYFYTKDLD